MTRIPHSVRALGIGIVCIALGYASWPGAQADATGSSGGGFCGRGMARDFLRPLERMVPIRRVPSSGRLEFGPRGLRLEPIGRRLVVGSGFVGFGLIDEAVGQTRHLGWDVSAEIQKVDARGTASGEKRSKRRRIGAVAGDKIGDLLFRVPADPAYCRMDISFLSSGSRRVLGTFSNYVRVVRPFFDARLLIQGEVVRRGEILPVRLANFGSETISSTSSDWRFAVERYDGQGWVAAPGALPKGKRIPLVRKLRAGQMGDCIYFRVPDNEQPGQYRFSMTVDRTFSEGRGRQSTLTAEFEVSGQRLM